MAKERVPLPPHAISDNGHCGVRCDIPLLNDSSCSRLIVRGFWDDCPIRDGVDSAIKQSSNPLALG